MFGDFAESQTRDTTEDIATLEERFSRVINFSFDEVSHARLLLKSALLGRFLGRSFPLEFIKMELKLRWGLKGNFNVSSLSEGILLFRLQSEEEKPRILANGS